MEETVDSINKSCLSLPPPCPPPILCCQQGVVPTQENPSLAPAGGVHSIWLAGGLLSLKFPVASSREGARGLPGSWSGEKEGAEAGTLAELAEEL